MPKRLYTKAKRALQEIRMAGTKRIPLRHWKPLSKTYKVKSQRAADCLIDNSAAPQAQAAARSFVPAPKFEERSALSLADRTPWRLNAATIVIGCGLSPK